MKRKEERNRGVGNIKEKAKIDEYVDWGIRRWRNK